MPTNVRRIRRVIEKPLGCDDLPRGIARVVTPHILNPGKHLICFCG